MTPQRWQQITRMFHAALLRNEVEAMLAAHDHGFALPSITDGS
jgi:hypothetical protein